jgi:copper chaperone NosL
MIAGLLLACATPRNEPAELAYDHVACDHCGMVVSDPRFAAQMTTATGERHEFDDPACVFLYIQDHTPAIAHVWFHDSTPGADEAAAWLDWQMVSFEEVSGAPMDGGLGAVPLAAGPMSFSEASTRVLTAHRSNR